MAFGGPIPKPAASREPLRVVGPHEKPPPAEPGRRLGAPTPPAGLSDAALAEWHRIVPELVRLGLLAEVEDQRAVASYCRTAALYDAALVRLESEGLTAKSRLGGEIQHPAFAVALRLSADLRAWMARLGLSPADRQRVAIDPQPEGDEPEELFR